MPKAYYSFEKDLLFFIPFYVLRFEKKLKEIESFSEIRKEFRETYEDILKHLKNLEKMKYIDYNYFIQLKALTTILITIVSRNNPSVVEEVEFMGGGQVIDAEAVLLEELKKTWIKAGLQEGREAGLQEGREAGLQEGREVGLQEGRERGLVGTIKSCQDLGGTKEQVKDLLIKNYIISEEDARAYIEKYW